MNEREVKYDIALSFAGEDRYVAEEIATELRGYGVTVFYDKLNKQAFGERIYTNTFIKYILRKPSIASF